jgi:hypothetical protein
MHPVTDPWPYILLFIAALPLMAIVVMCVIDAWRTL